MPACNGRLLRFRRSRTSSTLRSGSREPSFSTRPDLNLGTPLGASKYSFALAAWQQAIAHAVSLHSHKGRSA
ncbi:MAG: hypothetical protein E5X69_19705 [Mesorhizobium sp.]|nr:MAG: hypothetical protein E5X69_19705 [Mesorhizobium sp.]